MGKFSGPVGYSTMIKETSPGVWTEIITEYTYYGDVVKNTSRIRGSDKVNDNIIIDNQISIVADEFAYTNLHSIRYVKWMGILWKVASVNVQRPRLLLTIGDVYNGPIPISEPEDEEEP